jgi:hypothetical protein
MEVIDRRAVFHFKLHAIEYMETAAERFVVRLLVVLNIAAGSMFKSMLPCAGRRSTGGNGF